VEQHLAARHGRFQRCRVQQVAFDKFHIEVLEIAPVAAPAHQATRPLALRDKGPCHRRANEACATRDQNAHVG
jgi:hypothetical protein